MPIKCAMNFYGLNVCFTILYFATAHSNTETSDKYPEKHITSYNITTTLPELYAKAHRLIKSEGKDKITRHIYVETIPLIQKKRSYEDTVKSLSDFALERRKTHVSLPDFRVEAVKDITVSSDEHKVMKLKRSLLKKEMDQPRKGREKKDIQIEITKSKIVREKEKAKLIEKEDQNQFDPEKIDLREINEDLLETLKIQSETMNQLIHQIEKDNLRKSAYADFEEIVNNMEQRRNMTKQKIFSDPTPDYTFMPTVQMQIDEHSVKKALKNDPYVQRILKLSSLKREHYLNKKKQEKS